MLEENEMVDKILCDGVVSATNSFIEALKFVAECDKDTAFKTKDPLIKEFFNSEAKKAVKLAKKIEEAVEN
jgi:ABC-type transporter Mla maintaining outer membrane lipid asymmetry ATPase subunit MlaF